MKKFIIKTRRDGQQDWKELENVPIYASSFNEAVQMFKDWFVSWLSEINNDHAITQAEAISNQPAADTYSYDSENFTIRRV